MKFLELKTKNPYYNLAVEEYLFENTNEDVFMLWQNEPTVVIGRNQNAYAELKLDKAKEHGVHIARRITGGGAVYHDLGNLNYTFISVSESEGLNFERFTAPIISALKSMGVSASLGGRNDIEVNGRKISGNAQCKKEGRVLHHGTLLFDADLDFLSGILSVDEEKIKAKAIKSTRSRVANIKELLPCSIDIGDFIGLISDYVVREFSAEQMMVPKAEQIPILEARNSSEEWLFPSSSFLSEYSVHKKRRYPFGTVEIYVDMFNDTIRRAKLLGDFFEVNDVSLLESKLAGLTIRDIRTLRVGDYIFGMSGEDLSSLIYK